MTLIPELSADDSPAAMCGALESAGCLVVTSVADEAARDAVRAELAPYIDAAQVGTADSPTDFYPGHTKRIIALIARSKTVRDWVLQPTLLSLCDHFLKPNCEGIQLHVGSALVIGPGARAQVLHREDDSYPFFPVPRPHLVLASMWAITDFTADNGATLLVPGSHRWEAGREAAPDEIVSAEMPAGSMLVWLGGTLHGAGENRSDGWRYGVFLSYSLGWLRQEENQFLDVPPDLAAELSPELRALVGYSGHVGLGFYDPRVGQERAR
jgi:ectoine hydroxylase-related dioxygenase (phytanoyl-CoA dioxygenase family)